MQVLSTFNASRSGHVNGQLAKGPRFTAMLNRVSPSIVAVHDTMNQIAEDTDVQAYYDRNDLHNAIQAAVAESSSYYDLAFVPQNYIADGSLHTLKVRSKRANVQLRYRRGYFAIDPSDPAHPSPERQKLMIADMSDALLAQSLNSTAGVLAAKLTPGRSRFRHARLCRRAA